VIRKSKIGNRSKLTERVEAERQRRSEKISPFLERLARRPSLLRTDRTRPNKEKVDTVAVGPIPTRAIAPAALVFSRSAPINVAKSHHNSEQAGLLSEAISARINGIGIVSLGCLWDQGCDRAPFP
jgi:hypothetical protein